MPSPFEALLGLKTFDVVVVPFPFTDRLATKRRPSAVVSAPGFNDGSGHAVLSIITSSSQPGWPGDLPAN